MLHENDGCTVEVFGLLLRATRIDRLGSHKLTRTFVKLQHSVALDSSAVSILWSAIMAHMRDGGAKRIKCAPQYVDLLGCLLWGVVQAHANSINYGVPCSVTYKRYEDFDDLSPGCTITNRLISILADLGFITSTVTPSGWIMASYISATPTLLAVLAMHGVGTRLVDPLGQCWVMSKPSPMGDKMRLQVKNLTLARRDYIRQAGSVLTAINKSLSIFRFRITDEQDRAVVLPHGATQYHAVWNNGDIKQGGRNYCQLQNERQRSFPIRETLEAQQGIVAPWVRMVEADFSCFHIRCCYARVGVEVSHGVDLYAVIVPGWPRTPDQRSLIKVLTLCLPNVGDDNKSDTENLSRLHRTAASVYNKWRAEDYEARTLPAGVTPSKIADALLAHHAPIAKFLLGGVGIYLQAMDGEIARAVMLYFASRAVPCIGIHDSFMVPEAHIPDLLVQMRRQYKLAMTRFWPTQYDGSDPVVEVKKLRRVMKESA